MANDWHAAWYQEGKEDSSIAQRHKSGDVFKHIENFVKTADGCANEHVSPYTSSSPATQATLPLPGGMHIGDVT